MDSDVESAFDDFQDESDAYSPEPKAAAAKPAAKAAPKKMTQTTLKTKVATKKRAKPDSDGDDDDDGSFDGNMSNTPPNAKKQKKEPVKKGGGKPLGEIENDSFMQLDGPSEAAPANRKTATEQYKKLSQVEHILVRPDTYIGSIERTESQMWVFNKEKSLMEFKSVKLVPGFYKIFDEILVNAADNKQRDKGMSYIKITINRAEGEITVENDGKGIPIEMHEKEGIYIPELVFGHLLAGSNFDDNEKKTVGGRNGYGAKLCNVFSTEFTLECQDSTNGKRYKTTWRNNMGKMDKPKITSNKSKDFVRVTFKPDFAKFAMHEGIDDDTEAVMYRRVYDLAGTVEGVKVHLNGEHLKVGFKKYCEMYAKAIAKERQDVDADGTGPAPATVIFEDTKAHQRWQVGFTVSDGSFQQVSFVNSIATTSGGTHVNYIADQICAALLKDLTKKMKGHSLKANHIRNHIFIFVNCLIDNPAFTSQTKEQMTTKVSAFGSKCSLTDGFIKKIRATDAIDNILHFAEKKADKMLAKSDGNKRSRISNEKLVDANLAGTKHGHECTLILTEGDSARGLAVAGRAILDPDRIGVFPLRGKMLNVRDASIDQILKNQEISNIKQFMGLKHKETYTDAKRLRYGHLMIMADQDHDGSHIKGLLINFLQVQFPSLLQIPDFFREFTTPVVKVWQGPNPKKPLKLRSFFTMPEYEDWKEKHHHEINRWHYKYFKGLGTSTNEDAQVYFTDLDNHLKEFHTMKQEETELFELAFSKKKADARKEWLGKFVPGTFLDHSTKSITYTDFVNKELILFSMADNLRSIPSVVDGLKPGQRKVVFACFKRNLTKDKKVVELAGYVSEQTAYHHGEASLQQTIIGLAQNFVGSNNVNILEPSGNFGSRLAGGSDAASARYIFTRLSPFARRVFSALDEPVLEAQFEDGKQIEPKVYAPVLPMVLCNGADGIGTGWSTSIPNYHPMDIINNLKRRMGRVDGLSEEAAFETMTPWFRGWKGQAEPEGPGRYKFNGIATQDKPNEVLVTELPIRTWTDDFKARLEQIIRGDKGLSWIKDYKEFNDHRNVHFEIQIDDKVVKKAIEDNDLLEKFKLTKSIGTTNLVAFDPRGQIRKYDNVEQILEEFYLYRLGLYTERRAYWLRVLDDEYEKLKNMARFIEDIINGKIVVAKKKKAVLVQELRAAKYRPFPKGQIGNKVKNTDEEMDQDQDDDAAKDDEEVNTNIPGAGDYDYLLSMQIYSLTLERLERLKKQIADKKAEKDELEALSEKDLWCKDLDAFVEEWENQMRLDDEIRSNIRKMGRRVSKKIGAGKGGKRSKNEDDEYDPGSKSKARSNMKTGRTPNVSDGDGGEFATVSRPKPKAAPAKMPSPMDMSEDDDDDFIAPSKSNGKAKAAPAKKPSPVEEVKPSTGRSKRAAASKAKKWAFDTDEESESDGDNMIGDVGALVRGIGEPAAASTNGRLSLFAMSRSEHGNAAMPKLKTKQARANFDMDSPDDTNYELLAKSSPQKPTKSSDIDELMSEDEDAPATSKTQAKPKQGKAPLNVVSAGPAKKVRGRPAGSKNAKSKDDAKPTKLSPAAKAYAAKNKSSAAGSKGRKKAFDLSDDEDDDGDGDVRMEDSPPAPVARAASGRPGRAAAAKKKSYALPSEDEDMSDVGSGGSDVYAMDSD
ncbi:type II DNA topoisomerase [Cryphonectria parasitica EP155]|uniref:DNA topoisomerase 2 n=1 Tax=Cryphonectria parasitica (strain ATCC 38755 / EP155) TaxID=660469 RepID=A0A9P4Y4W7_CRYP1|nr:type II DNA topoisomerase [Cryphonectria parasitica EP155]KAF3766768.1 type II DNA topoisomerase [Cryphonectria parasitica EP155]